MNLIKHSFLEAQQVLNDFVAEEENLKKVQEAGDMLVEMFRRGAKSLVVETGDLSVMLCILQKN